MKIELHAEDDPDDLTRLSELTARSGRPLVLGRDGHLHLCASCVTAMCAYGGITAN